MKIRSILFAGAVLAASANVAAAQAPLSDAEVRSLIDLMLDNITRASCGRAMCTPATAAERRAPPLSVRDARRVVARAQLSASAEWCGLDWQQRSYLPLVNAARTAGTSERTMALVGLMHGYVQGQGTQSLRRRGACPPAVREDTERRLAAVR